MDKEIVLIQAWENEQVLVIDVSISVVVILIRVEVLVIIVKVEVGAVNYVFSIVDIHVETEISVLIKEHKEEMIVYYCCRVIKVIVIKVWDVV